MNSAVKNKKSHPENSEEKFPGLETQQEVSLHDKKALEKFLEQITGWDLFPDGYIEVVDNYYSAKYFSHDQLQEIYAYVTQIAKAGRECHFGPALRKDDLGAKRSDSGNLCWAKAFWVDIDPPDKDRPHEKRIQQSKELLDQFLEKLKSYNLEPTFVIFSGNGYQVYFVIGRLHMPPSDDWQRIENALVAAANGDWQAKDPTRILRVPFTFNYKEPENPRPVTMVQSSGDVFQEEDFEPLVKEYGLKRSESSIGADQTETSPLGFTPPCISHLLDPETPIPKGFRHAVRLILGTFAFRENWDLEEAVQKIMHTTSTPRKAQSDIKRIYRMLQRDPGRYSLGCKPGSRLRGLVDEGITVCDEDSCRFGSFPPAESLPFQNDIFEKDRKYCRREMRGSGKDFHEYIQTLSSFVIEPQVSILVDGREYINATLISESDYEVKDVELPPEFWLSKQRFLSRLPGKEFSFIGSDRDVQLIKHLISKKSFPTKFGYQTVGMHNVDDEWICLTNEGAVGQAGPVDHVVLMDKSSDYQSNLLSAGAITKEDLKLILGDLAGFNVPVVVAPVLGWTVACFFKPRLQAITGSFPLLSVFGEPGSGKTVTIRKVVLGIHGLAHAEKSASDMTKFTLMISANASNSFPLFLDEYKPSRLTREQTNILSSYIRSTYNSLSGDRGQQDLSRIVYRYMAPTVIAGEDQLIEPAARERILEVQFVKSRSVKYASKFKSLKAESLTALGKAILEKCLMMSDEEVAKIFSEELGKVDPVFEGRYRVNVAVGRFGLRVLDEIVVQITGWAFPITAKDLEQSQKETLVDNSTQQQNIVDRIIEAIFILIRESQKNKDFPSQYRVTDGVHYHIRKDEIRLHLQSVYPIFRKWAKDYDFEGDIINQKAFFNQVKHEDYFKAYKVAQISPSTPKTQLCLIIDLGALRLRGIGL
jgi:hypothetical protein